MAANENERRAGLEAGMKCLEELRPAAERKRRAERCRELIQRLSDYRRFLAELQADEACPGRKWQLGDRAFEAEANVRMLLAEALECVNDVRDSGLLHPCLNDFAQWAAGEENLNARLRKALTQAEAQLPRELLDELAGGLERRGFSVTYNSDANELVLGGRALASGTPALTRVRLAPQVGDVGRIGIDEFFSASGRAASYAAQPVFVPPDCHHRQTVSGATGPGGSIDAYSSVVATLAYARESMYRHVRKVSEYGHGRSTVRANDPGTAELIGFLVAVVGLLLIGFGFIGLDPLGLGSPGREIGFGVTLLIGGILIFAWGAVVLAAAAAAA